MPRCECTFVGAVWQRQPQADHVQGVRQRCGRHACARARCQPLRHRHWTVHTTVSCQLRPHSSCVVQWLPLMTHVQNVSWDTEPCRLLQRTAGLLGPQQACLSTPAALWRKQPLVGVICGKLRCRVREDPDKICAVALPECQQALFPGGRPVLLHDATSHRTRVTAGASAPFSPVDLEEGLPQASVCLSIRVCRWHRLGHSTSTR